MTEIRDYSENRGWQLATAITDVLPHVRLLNMTDSELGATGIDSLLNALCQLASQASAELDSDYAELERLRLQVATNQGKVSQEG